VTREDKFAEHIVTVLLDERIYAICKCGPVTKLNVMLVGATQSAKLLLEKGHRLRKMETGL
jgi:hypothetical protein